MMQRISYTKPMFQLVQWVPRPDGGPGNLAQVMRVSGTLKKAIASAAGIQSAENYISIIRVKDYVDIGQPVILDEYDVTGKQTY